MKNITKWKRIALATDLDWMISVASLFGWITPGELKPIPVTQRDGPSAWAAATDDNRMYRRDHPPS